MLCQLNCKNCRSYDREDGWYKKKSSRKRFFVKPININCIVEDGQDKIKKT